MDLDAGLHVHPVAGPSPSGWRCARSFLQGGFPWFVLALLMGALCLFC